MARRHRALQNKMPFFAAMRLARLRVIPGRATPPTSMTAAPIAHTAAKAESPIKTLNAAAKSMTSALGNPRRTPSLAGGGGSKNPLQPRPMLSSGLLAPEVQDLSEHGGLKHRSNLGPRPRGQTIAVALDHTSGPGSRGY
jgi:hypothetical protein